MIDKRVAVTLKKTRKAPNILSAQQSATQNKRKNKIKQKNPSQVQRRSKRSQLTTKVSRKPERQK